MATRLRIGGDKDGKGEVYRGKEGDVGEGDVSKKAKRADKIITRKE